MLEKFDTYCNLWGSTDTNNWISKSLRQGTGLRYPKTAVKQRIAVKVSEIVA